MITKDDRIYRGVKHTDPGSIEGEYSTDDGRSWTLFSANVGLFVIRLAFYGNDEAHDRIWAAQDGYGSAGYTPPQGRDWSGVRDSTSDAHMTMLAIALEYVDTDALADHLGLKEVAA